MSAAQGFAAACLAPRAPPRVAGQTTVVLDLSRLLSRALHSTPTGVDRVEMAYALALLQRAPRQLHFAAIHPCGLHGRVPTSAAVDFLHLTADRWERDGLAASRLQRWRRALAACLSLAPRWTLSRPDEGPKAYLHLSARGLERRRLFEAVLRWEQARFIPFVHDLIPLDHPEYARPAGAERYARKMATVAALASGVLVNSEATAGAVARRLAGGRNIPIKAAALGVSAAPRSGPAEPIPVRPYFVVLATIEPRKNHLLLLHLWRRLVSAQGADATPELVLVGRRGWENEMVLDLLDRCPPLRTVVRERSGLPDAAVRDLVRGARAVLLPSFAEGFGLPVAEALALGAPVIASDLPALREAGGAVPDYLDPLDGLGWEQAVRDYARPGAPRRAAQMRRLATWRAPSWDDHIESVLAFVEEVCR